jgi:hypothetical protein
VNHKAEVQHAGSTRSSDIVLIPQPTECGVHPLVSACGLNIYQSDGDTDVAKMEEVLPVVSGCTVRLLND